MSGSIQAPNCLIPVQECDCFLEWSHSDCWAKTLITEISDGNWFSYLSPEINSLFEIGINFVPKSRGGHIRISSLLSLLSPSFWLAEQLLYPVGPASDWSILLPSYLAMLSLLRKSWLWGIETKWVLVNTKYNMQQLYITYCTNNSKLKREEWLTRVLRYRDAMVAPWLKFLQHFWVELLSEAVSLCCCLW